MDNQNQKPVIDNQTPNQLPEATASPTVAAAGLPAKPKLHLSDSEVNDLLLLNNLQSGQPTKHKLPVKIVIAAIAVVVLIVVSSFFLGSLKSSDGSITSKSSSLGLPNQTPPSSGSDTTNQINQDVKTCSNLVNATTVC